jgi:hypothetical protein
MDEAATRSGTDGAPLATAGAAAVDWVRAAERRVRAVSALGLAEARLAALGTASMVFMAVLAAVFALTAWGLAIALVVALATLGGFDTWLTLLLLAALHAGCSVLCWHRAVALTAHWEFPETVRQLERLLGQQTGNDAA